MKMYLKYWQIISFNGKLFIVGNVYGNPNFVDGSPVRTSPIKKFVTRPDESKFVETQNSKYELK